MLVNNICLEIGLEICSLIYLCMYVCLCTTKSRNRFEGGRKKGTREEQVETNSRSGTTTWVGRDEYVVRFR